MAAKKVGDFVENDQQGLPSLVVVMRRLAIYWMLCECALKLGVSGPDGWRAKSEKCEDEIDFLNRHMERLSSPTEKAAVQTRIQTLETQSEALNEEWQQALEVTDTCCELFCDAREFCRNELGIGDAELFNAALVGFDPLRLQPGQGPSKNRMTELAMLLSNLNLDKWKSQPWATPVRPSMRTAKRIAPDRLNEFIAQNLKGIDSTSNDEPPYLGLEFNDDLTVSRLGNAYKDSCRISLSLQQFRILKFIHGAGESGRTSGEMKAERFTSLKQEKTKINAKLIPIDLRFKIYEHKLVHVDSR